MEVRVLSRAQYCPYNLLLYTGMKSKKSDSVWPAFIIPLLIVAGLIYYIQYSPAHKQSLITPSVTSSSTTVLNGEITITTGNITESSKSVPYDITAAYPIINGLDIPTRPIEDTINRSLYQIVSKDVDDFKSSLASSSSYPVGAPPAQNTLSISYASSTPSGFGNIVSFTISQELYSAPAAHPEHQVDSFSYDLNSGRQIYLSDLFNGDYLKAISAYASSTLKVSLGDYANTDMISQGTLPTADNFKVFIIKNDGLHIIFNEYQVAPYVVGEPEVVVPWGILKPFFLKENLI